MALPIRDGNQSPTTLSTIIVNNAHIPAHTVISFGTQGITDIATAVSGVELGPNTLNALENITITGGLTDGQLRASAVTIGGSVTATISGTASVTFGQAPVTFGTAVITGSTSILNFPATQTVTFTQSSVTFGEVVVTGSTSIIGTPSVTFTQASVTFGQSSITGSVSVLNLPATQTVTFTQASVTFGEVVVTGSTSILNFPATQTIAGTVTVGNSISIQSGNITIEEAFGQNSFMPIAGTVTANAFGKAVIGSTNYQIPIIGYDEDITTADFQITVPVQISSLNGSIGSGNPLPISGTVTLGAGTAQIGSVTASISNSLTISSLPAISGTVTASLSNAVSPSFPSGYSGDPYPAGTKIIPVGGWTDEADGAHWQALTLTDSGHLYTYTLLAPNTNIIGSVYSAQGTSPANTNFTSTTPNTLIAGAVTGRRVFTVFNEGAGVLHISPTGACTTASYQVRLSAGDYWECPAGQLSLLHTAVFATAGTARVTQVS